MASILSGKKSFWVVNLDHPIACDIMYENLLESVQNIFVLHLYDLEPNDNLFILWYIRDCVGYLF